MSESQLLSDGQSAACSQSTASSSYFSSTSSPSPSDTSGSSGYCDKDGEWSVTTSRPHKVKARKRQQSKCDYDDGVAIKKKVKNAREKERVRAVRQEYEELHAVLGDRVERGSGHFSKVGTLAAAIRCIEDLMKVRSQLGSDDAALPSPSTALQESRCEESDDISLGVSSADISPGNNCDISGINLSCDERLEPAEIHDLDTLPPLDLSTVPPVFSAATPYFSYSSPGDFPTNSSCMFPFPGSSPSLPPPSSLLCSPDLAGHPSLPTIPMAETLSPLTMSPPPHPYQCGSDVWLAIGCN